MPQIKHKSCRLCHLHKSAYTVCLNGVGSDNPKVVVFLDNPSSEEDRRHEAGFSKYVQFVVWLFKRMSISKEDYRIEFSLRCYAEPDAIKTKVLVEPLLNSCYIHSVTTLQRYSKAILVGMGKLTCFQFLGSLQHGQYAGCDWEFQKKTGRKMWITYSPGAVFQSPAESPAIYRVLFRACEQANLKPKFNPNIQLFDYEQ